VEYDHVLGRELKTGGGATDNDTERFQAIYAKGQYALHPLLNVYVRLGAGEMERRVEDAFLENIGRRDLTFDSDWGFAWGAGLGGAISLPWGLKTGYDASYVKADADIESVTHADNVLAFSRAGTSVSGDLTWEEFQVALWVGRPFPLRYGTVGLVVDPYVGGKWSDLNFDVDGAQYTVTDAGFSQIVKFTQASGNAESLGVVLGCRLLVNDRVSMKVEGRLVDDYAVAGSASWRF